MLKKKFLTFEWFFVILFAIQTIWPFSSNSSWIFFGLILLIKHFQEGFRLNIIIFLLSQIVIATVAFTIVRVLIVFVSLFAVYYFPVFRFPRAMGLFFAAYKPLKLRNGIEVSVYYPTTELTEPVPLLPSKKAWSRFHRYLKSRNGKLAIPGWIFRISLSFLQFIELPIQNGSKIIAKEHLNHGKKFPVILLSHGIACNRNMYSAFAREWASNGYMVFSIDRGENFEIPNLSNKVELQKSRSSQLRKRKEEISRVLDYISKHENVTDLFEDDGIELDLDKVSIVGHAIGGTAAAYTAMTDKRINGVCILLDPALDGVYEEFEGKSIGLPIMLIRTKSTEGSLLGGRPGKEMMMELISNNKENQKYSMSCIFENASHISLTDLVLHMPRECVMFKMMTNMNEVEEAVLAQNRLTQMYLDTMLFEKDPYGMRPTVEAVLKKFNSFVKRSGKKNTLLLDKMK